MNPAELRQRLMNQGLSRNDMDASPLKQFESWYAETIETHIHEPGAMSVATVDKRGVPSQRLVLLKLFDEKGFVFFTNYESVKAQQINHNPGICLLFPWHSLGRQLKIIGSAEKVSTAESLAYFTTRLRGSQLGAWASGQSQMINSRTILETMVNSMKKKYANKEVPLPPFWGGYRVRPESYEFWQERQSRLHDRFLYQKDEKNEWRMDRLAP